MSAGWERPAGRAPRGRRDRHMGPADRARFRPRRSSGQALQRPALRPARHPLARWDRRRVARRSERAASGL